MSSNAKMIEAPGVCLKLHQLSTVQTIAKQSTWHNFDSFGKVKYTQMLLLQQIEKKIFRYSELTVAYLAIHTITGSVVALAVLPVDFLVRLLT